MERFLEIHNDVSELPAPEPLIRTINMLHKITEGSYMKMIHRMRPCNLYAALGNLGFAYIEKERQEGVEIYIFLANDSECERYLRERYES